MRMLVTQPLIPQVLWATLVVLSAAAVAAYVLVRPPRVSRARNGTGRTASPAMRSTCRRSACWANGVVLARSVVRPTGTRHG